MAKDYKRRPGACEFCRIKKFRCDGGLPQCERCEIMGKECIYLPSKKRGRRSKCVQPFSIDDLTMSDASDEWAQFPTPFSGSSPPLTWLGPASSHLLPTDIESLMTLGNTDPSSGLSTSPSAHARNDSVLLADCFDMCDDISAQDLHGVPRSLTSEMVRDSGDTVLGYLSRDGSFLHPDSGAWDVETCEQSHNEALPLPHPDFAVSSSAFSYQDILRNIIHSRKNEALVDDDLGTTIEKAWSSWCTPEDRRSTRAQRAVLSEYSAARSALHAFRDLPFRGARCINHATLAKMAEEVLVDHNSDAKRIITVHSAIATGIILGQRENGGEERRATALAHYRHAFAHVAHLQGYKSSIIAFQAIVLLLVAAMQLSRADVDQLLDNACARAQALAIRFQPSRSSADNGTHDDVDSDELRNTFWLLYSIEKPARMEAGFISALNDNFINAGLPSNLSGPIDDAGYKFLAHIGLAQLCSQMLDKLYNAFAHPEFSELQHDVDVVSATPQCLQSLVDPLIDFDYATDCRTGRQQSNIGNSGLLDTQRPAHCTRRSRLSPSSVDCILCFRVLVQKGARYYGSSSTAWFCPWFLRATGSRL
ncbi:hypothetical protein BST61_g10275 [Cercospora zeina]